MKTVLALSKQSYLTGNFAHDIMKYIWHYYNVSTLGLPDFSEKCDMEKFKFFPKSM